jgi:hypothetical protein
VEDEEECNQSDEVSFFVDTKRINIVETKISYINVITYTCIDGEKTCSCIVFYIQCIILV